jgi:hypothetical protein
MCDTDRAAQRPRAIHCRHRVSAHARGCVRAQPGCPCPTDRRSHHKKRPDPPCRKRRAGTCHNAPTDRRVMTDPINSKKLRGWPINGCSHSHAQLPFRQTARLSPQAQRAYTCHDRSPSLMTNHPGPGHFAPWRTGPPTSGGPFFHPSERKVLWGP